MKKIIMLLIAGFFMGLAGLSAHAESLLAGTWKVADTEGSAFTIVLNADGTATADRAGEGMKGTWKETDGAAVISWDSGWTTKISKDGDTYVKTAYDKGKPLDGEPSNMSAAEKVE